MKYPGARVGLVLFVIGLVVIIALPFPRMLIGALLAVVGLLLPWVDWKKAKRRRLTAKRFIDSAETN